MGDTFKYLITVSSEMPIKSWRSRPRFYRTLISNLSKALERGGLSKPKHSIRIIGAKIVLESEVDALEDLSRVFGVARVAEVEVIDFSDLKELIGKVGELTAKLVTNKKFAVRVKRSGVHNFTSIDVAKELGAYLKPYSVGVDLENPDVEVVLEVRGSRAYLHRRSVKGFGGLPIGTEGCALSLFSGGIDSPVAAWLTAKRGVKVDYLHFFMGSPKSTRLAYTAARTLTSMWFYGHRPKLYVVDLTGILNQVREKVVWEFRQIVLRTLMYLIGAEVASRNSYNALITGESIGQTSSQTLANLSTAQAVANVQIPILRPLIGFDKEEVVNLARTIGTYEVSCRVGEPCAIAPSRVRTKASREELRMEVDKIPREIMVRTIDSLKILDVLASSPNEVLPDNLVIIDFMPEDAVVIDLRDKEEYLEWHYPGALHYEDVDVESMKGRTIVLYCWRGSKSYVEASKLRARGFKAYSFAEGVDALKNYLEVGARTSCGYPANQRSLP